MYICATLLLLDWGFSTFLGARKVSGQWRWQGRVTERIAYDWWATNQPSGGSQICLGTSEWDKYKFNDVFCDSEKYFLCEKASNF